MSNNLYTLPQANPNITESSISSWIRNGNGFIASYANSTVTNANLKMCAFSIFNPSNSGKNVIIYSIRINSQTSSVGSDNAINTTTSDPSGTTGYLQTFSAINQGAGTLSSVVSLSATSTAGAATTVTATGTVVDLFGSTSNASTELLSNGAIFFLPNGLAKGISIFEHVSTVGNVFGATLRWIEY